MYHERICFLNVMFTSQFSDESNLCHRLSLFMFRRKLRKGKKRPEINVKDFFLDCKIITFQGTFQMAIKTLSFQSIEV
jgi:hypothetical protein